MRTLPHATSVNLHLPNENSQRLNTLYPISTSEGVYNSETPHPIEGARSPFRDNFFLATFKNLEILVLRIY
jgi:hypothetical protein